MSGICGVLGFSGSDGINEALLDRMCEILKHRGPNGTGKYLGFEINKSKYRAGLGHCRLAAGKLSAGPQPICNEEESAWIACDGNIYNYNELHDICVKKGHTFRSQTDVETILHLYEDYGSGVVKYLRGSFAFAIWDNTRKLFFLARDHVGNKPLYYTFFGNSFIFASEIKAIFLYTGVRKRLNWEAFNQYLNFSAVCAPLTFFEGIYKLDAAHIMTVFENGKTAKEEYWDIFDNKPVITLKSEKDYIQYLSDSFDDALKCQIRDDVSRGVFLSAGVDSLLITAFLSRHVPFKTFTMKLNDSGCYNNLKCAYARKISKLFNTRHYEIILNEENFSGPELQKILYYSEEPLLSPIDIFYYFICKSARNENVNVVYTGEGTDVLFGYPFWEKLMKYKIYLDAFSQMPYYFRSFTLKLLTFLGKRNFAYELMRRAFKNEPFFKGGLNCFYFTRSDKTALFCDELHDKLDDKLSNKLVADYYKKFMGDNSTGNYRYFMSYLDYKIRITEAFIARRDRMSAANSLEIRTPFQDHKFIEAAINLPQSLKLKNNISKYILKKMCEPFIPKEIIYMKKIAGWDGCIYWYFDKLMRNNIASKINSFNRQTNFFKQKYLNSFVLKNKTIENIKIWRIYSFILWYEKWIEAKEVVEC